MCMYIYVYICIYMTYSNIPKLHQSTTLPYFCPLSNSGAMYSAVPQNYSELGSGLELVLEIYKQFSSVIE